MPSLSKNSIAALLGLVETKLSCLEVYDREDAREKCYLENSRRELAAMMKTAGEPAHMAGPRAPPTEIRWQSRSATP
jgi:hypothetical protein